MKMKKAAQQVRLVHNPTAGDEEHSKKQLVTLIEAKGYVCNYASSKKTSLKAISAGEEIIAMAGGDGTIRKTMLYLLNKKLKFKRPLAILPFGTANNIAGSFSIGSNYATYIAGWNKAPKRALDIGYVQLKKDEHHFVESFGLGLFPRLMKEMDRVENPQENPKLEMELALSKLIELIKTMAAFPCNLVVDNKEISGNFIMVEVMNIPRLGPQLNFATHVNPSDGYLDLVLVAENQRYDLVNYIEKLANGKQAKFPFKTYKLKSAQLNWNTNDVRLDDELLQLNKEDNASIFVLPALFNIICNA